jgi:hypothetical protein
MHPPSEDEEQTVIWGWGALAPVSEQNGARAPHPHEILGLAGPAGAIAFMALGWKKAAPFSSLELPRQS